MSTGPRNRSTPATPPVPTEELEAMLTRLRLPAICDRLVGAGFSAGVALLEEGARREMNLREALTWQCAAEVARKEQLRMEMALRLTRFPDVRTLEAFDFEARPSIDPAQIRALVTCRWVANGDTLLVLGPPGVGKTHPAVALGREAVRLVHGIQYVGAMEPICALAKAQTQHALEARLSQYSKSRLLIIDELGYLPLEPNAAYLFFQLICRCCQRGRVLITSNRPVMEWGEVFGEQVVATAILDRLLHHSHVLTIRGDRFRLREKRRSGLLRPGRRPEGLPDQAAQMPQPTTTSRHPPMKHRSKGRHQAPIRWTGFRVASGPHCIFRPVDGVDCCIN